MVRDRQQLKKEMLGEWNECAHRNWRHYLWAESAESEESFRASGERDYKRFAGNFLSEREIDPTNMVALEIGCGAGRVSEFLARNFHGLVALDISKEMLKIARERVSADNVLWLNNDGTGLEPIADNSVDFIFSLGVFQQIPDAATVAGYVEEAGRVLASGGWFVFQVMNQPHFSLGLWKISFFVSRRFHVPRFRVYKPGALDADPIRIEIVRRSCASTGLDVVRILHRFTQNTWIWAHKKP